ncbi:MAG: 1-acyl-sn-glycerol-3-phosphate acyltransferase [Bacteroidales bacterium]|nr:1-acyl-sn-glycerol-3-phosphate acyltransferase [Bacteroidales bacterium]
MAKIHDHSTGYRILRLYSDFCTYMAYGRTEIVGRENIPQNAAVIFAPNHCNTLMDAMVVLRARRDATVFGCRADLFRNPLANKALRYLKILPMPRVRDGIREVMGNIKTNAEVVDSITDNVPFCAFPEGTHRPKHSLLPVRKGIVRIAKTAIDKTSKPIYIVPVGLEYGDYYRFQSTSLVNYGKAIDVTEFFQSHPDLNEVELYREVTNILKESMSQLITYIPDDEDYDAKWPLIKAIVAPLRGTPKARLEKNRAAATRVEELWQNETLRGVLREKALAFEADRKACGISTHSFGFKKPVVRLCFKTLLLLGLLPVALVFAAIGLPMLIMSTVLVSKIKDKAFSNSVRYISYLALLLPLQLIWTILGFAAFHLSWIWVLAGIVGLILAFPFVFRYKEAVRVWISDIKLMSNKKLRRSFDEIRDAVR